jgi:hypothetical protein
MRHLFVLLALMIPPLPLSAQPPTPARQQAQRMRFPPDIVAPGDVVRDIVGVDSVHVRVDLENDRSRVLRLNLGAGEAVPAHDDRAGVLVCLTDCRLRFTSPEGGTQDLELKAGETKWLPAARRATRNAGSARLELLYIETKRTQT